MKKNILLVMAMMLMTAVNALAQKEYNMVITLNNGTTVTLGHNDIKEITFNDGEVAISGNMVNTIDSLAGVTLALDNKITEVANATSEGFITLGNAIDAKFNDYAVAFDSVIAFMEAQDALNQSQSELNEILLNQIIGILDIMEQLHPELAGEAAIRNAKSLRANARPADMKAALDNLKKALENINKK
ncbi:MAG: hypothetical protein ACI358_05340 [Candidatus Limimorpha sp.]